MFQEQASDPTLRLKPKEGKASVDAPTRLAGFKGDARFFNLKVPELAGWSALEFTEMLVDYFPDGQVGVFQCA